MLLQEKSHRVVSVSNDVRILQGHQTLWNLEINKHKLYKVMNMIGRQAMGLFLAILMY